MTRLYNYLNERTFDIDQDVDLLYKKGFKKIIDKINKGDFDYLIDLAERKKWNNKKSLDLYTTTSKELRSEECVKAHNITPIKIYCGIYKHGSLYNMANDTVYCSLHPQAFEFLLQSRDWTDVMDEIPASQFDRFRSEFTESAMKATIYHELSHWLNDTLHNKNVRQYKKKRLKTGETRAENLSFVELDAQIHAIKQLKRDIKSWDRMTWKELIIQKPSFLVVFTQAVREGKDEYNDFMKKLVKRLNRENLLGKNLRKIPDYYDMKGIIGSLN